VAEEDIYSGIGNKAEDWKAIDGFATMWRFVDDREEIPIP